MSILTIPDLSLVLYTETSPPSRPKYHYTPLPTQGWIRILVLRPGPTTDCLTCTLKHQTIQDASVSGFEALSYVWGGDGQDGSEIDCDGQAICVGENLASALKHIRRENETRNLWVDAVCIDQENVEERSKQVQQMGDIYASAERVLIWVGPDNSHEAHDCFKLIQDTTRILIDLISKHGDVNLIPTITPESGLICSDTRKWKMVRSLIDTDWFSRVWVLPEVGLARSAVVLYGKSSMDWSYLVEMMLIVASRVDVSAQVGNIKSGMIWDCYDDLWRSYGNTDSWRNELPLTKSLNSSTGGKASFINILNDTRAYNVTDQRDRVYAFLSHPSVAGHHPREERLFVPDYHLSVDQVYLDTARRILSNDSNPWTVLACVDHPSAFSSLTGQRPSWVPRWDEGWRVYWLGHPEMWYRAGGDEPALFDFEGSESEPCLRTKGVLLDSIGWTSRVFDSEELRLEPQQEETPVQHLWEEVQRLDTKSSIYGANIEDREHAFSIALAAGRSADDGPAEDDPDHHRAVYQAYKVMVGKSKLDPPTLSSPEGEKDGIQSGELVRDSIELEALTYIGSNQRSALHNRRFFCTRKGYYGVGHREVKVGDVCCVIRGANVPFVLRKVMVDSGPGETTGRVVDGYLLVGEAYIQGVMRGELFQDAEIERCEQTVMIV